MPVSWPGKNPPQTCMYPGEICSSIAGMDSARATGLAAGNAARISGSPRKWSAWGCVMYTYPGSQSWDFTQAASFRPSCSVMRQSTSRAPPSSLIRVEVDGGQVAGPTASAKPGTALGIGFGSTTNTSKSRLIASSGSADSGGQRTPGPLCPWVDGHHAPCSPEGRRQGIRMLTAPLPAAGAVRLPIPPPSRPRQTEPVT